MQLALRLLAVVVVGTLALVAGASARNGMKGPTGSKEMVRVPEAQRRMTPSTSPVVQRFQHGPDHRAQRVGQGHKRVAKTGS